MSDYNDGSRFGGDMVSPYDDYPLSFESVELPSGRNMLASHTEQPREPARVPVQLDAVAPAPLTRRVESFSASRIDWLSSDDQQLLLIFLVLVVVVMQIKMMMQLDMQHQYHPYHHPQPQYIPIHVPQQ